MRTRRKDTVSHNGESIAGISHDALAILALLMDPLGTNDLAKLRQRLLATQTVHVLAPCHYLLRIFSTLTFIEG